MSEVDLEGEPRRSTSGLVVKFTCFDVGANLSAHKALTLIKMVLLSSSIDDFLIQCNCVVWHSRLSCSTFTPDSPVQTSDSKRIQMFRQQKKGTKTETSSIEFMSSTILIVVQNAEF